MSRDRRAVARMQETGESYSVALHAVRAQYSASRTARLAIVMRSRHGWSDTELDALESHQGSLTFDVTGSDLHVVGEIDSADISDDPSGGERLDITLRVPPDVAEELQQHQPLDVVLGKSALHKLARAISKTVKY